MIKVSSSGSIILTVADSPFSNSPTKVLELTYISYAGTPLTVRWVTFSIRAYAPEVLPIIFLFVNNTKLKVSYKTLITELLAGAVVKTNFLNSFLTA